MLLMVEVMSSARGWRWLTLMAVLVCGSVGGRYPWWVVLKILVVVVGGIGEWC